MVTVTTLSLMPRQKSILLILPKLRRNYRFQNSPRVLYSQWPRSYASLTHCNDCERDLLPLSSLPPSALQILISLCSSTRVHQDQHHSVDDALPNVAQRGENRGMNRRIDDVSYAGDVVFDADGTLWDWDVGDQLITYLHHHHYILGSSSSTLQRPSSSSIHHPSSIIQHSSSPSSIITKYMHLLAIDPPSAYKFAVEMFHGWSSLATHHLARTMLLTYAGDTLPPSATPPAPPTTPPAFILSIYPYVIPLLTILQRYNYRVWIVSASPAFVVQQGIYILLQLLNDPMYFHKKENIDTYLSSNILHAQPSSFLNVIGVNSTMTSSTSLSSDTASALLSGHIIHPLPFSEGKVAALRQHGISAPSLGFGNGDGDIHFLKICEKSMVIAPLSTSSSNVDNTLVRYASEHKWPIIRVRSPTVQ